MRGVNLIEEAYGLATRIYDESKTGDDLERAKVLAILALAQAVEDHGQEIAGMGTGARPFVVDND